MLGEIVVTVVLTLLAFDKGWSVCTLKNDHTSRGVWVLLLLLGSFIAAAMAGTVGFLGFPSYPAFLCFGVAGFFFGVLIKAMTR